MLPRLAPAITIAAILASAPAFAGGGSDPRVAARALAEHAYALFEQGKYEQAIEIFQQAERLYHAPTLVLAMAKAHVAAGKLVEAKALYQQVIDERIQPGAPRAFRDAQATARADLAALDERIPTLQIAVRGGGGRGLRVMIDDADVAGWSAGAAQPVNPGRRRITVVPSGGVGVSRTVDVREGARDRVEIELPGAAPAVAPASSEGRSWLVPSLMGFGLGAVGLGLGVGAGVATLQKASALHARCAADVCPPTAQNRDDLSAAKGLSTASTIGFVVAGAGVVTGAVLLVVRPGSKGPERVSVAVGPGSIGIAGVFR